MFCVHCGKELYSGAFFCTNCGTKVAQPEVQVQSVSATVQDTTFKTAQESSETVQVMQPMSAVLTQEMAAPVQEPEVTAYEPEPPKQVAEDEVQIQMPEVGAHESETQVQEPTAPFMSSEPIAPMDAAVPQQPIAADNRTIPGPGQQAAAPAQTVIPPAQTAVPSVQAEPKQPKKGVIIAVVVVAVLVFLIGMIGAFYFAATSQESDDNRTVAQRGEFRGYNEDSQEDSDESEGGDEEDFAEGDSESQNENLEEDLNGGYGEGEDPLEEDSEETDEQYPWEDEDFPEEPEIRAFSGRDIYPDIDGYAEGYAGDTLHTYWFDYTVTSGYICTEYGGYTPSAGNELLVVEIAVRSTVNDSIPMYDDDFQAQWNDPADDAYAWPVLGAERLGENILPESYTLESGQMVTGLLLYEVPEGYSEFSISFLEHFSDDSYGDVFFMYFTADRGKNNISL